MTANAIARKVKELTLTIESGSDNVIFALGGEAWGIIQLPAAMTGSQITFLGSIDGTNFTAAPVLGHESNPGAVAGSAVLWIPAAIYQCKFMQLLSDATELADRSILYFAKG